jgi:hypothetical protein
MKFVNYLLSGLLKFLSVIICFGIFDINSHYLTKISGVMLSIVTFMISDKLLEEEI